MTIRWTDEDRALLDRLNSASWTRTFSPADIDWRATTTADEFSALYGVWSLFLGTRHEARLDPAARVLFAKYQQMNLMGFTALAERSLLVVFGKLYGDDGDARYHEYISHLVKEESYHYLMFQRAIARIRATDERLRPLPQRPMHTFLRLAVFAMRLLPSRALRHGTAFGFLRFAEEISLQAHVMVKRTIAREESLVATIWAMHARDESRHVVFDDLMLAHAQLPRPLHRVPGLFAKPLCVVASVLLNLNEIWAARRLGIDVGYHELPALMQRTTAPFKRKVFGILRSGAPRAGAAR